MNKELRKRLQEFGESTYLDVLVEDTVLFEDTFNGFYLNIKYVKNSYGFEIHPKGQKDTLDSILFSYYDIVELVDILKELNSEREKW